MNNSKASSTPTTVLGDRTATYRFFCPHKSKSLTFVNNNSHFPLLQDSGNTCSIFFFYDFPILDTSYEIIQYFLCILISPNILFFLRFRYVAARIRISFLVIHYCIVRIYDVFLIYSIVDGKCFYCFEIKVYWAFTAV